MNMRLAELDLRLPVLLAPMAGITDLPFRRLVASFGAGLVVSEMVASRELARGGPGARERAELGFGEAATAVQLVGREPHWMAEAARIAEDGGARAIDINMGCPAKRVAGGAAGAALMKDLDQALRLLDAVVDAVGTPVTVKTRLGWDETSLNAPDLARRAEAAGARMIAVHGRTRSQFFKGRADWDAIRAVSDAVSIPVIANGDIVMPSDARDALARSGADGVMIGRGIQGAPWRLAETAAALGRGAPPRIPDGPGFAAMAAGHYEDALSFYGASLGSRIVRKHLGWYMDRAGTPRELRREVLSAPPAGVLRRLPDALAAGSDAARAA